MLKYLLGPNLNLRNGTRMKVVKMMDRSIECEVLVGTSKGHRVCLPRIPHHDRSGDYPFTIVRRQFPVRLDYLYFLSSVLNLMEL